MNVKNAQPNKQSNKQPNWAGIRGIIWDLDDTLYSVTPPLLESMRESIAKTVVALDYPISYEEALALAEQSQDQHRLTAKILVEKFQIPPHDIHIPFHDHMDPNVTEICSTLPRAFARADTIVADLQHVIMTHASKNWALRMLERMGIAHYFPDTHIFGLEDIDYKRKSSSARAAEVGLEVMGLTPAEVAFAEDRDHNLTIPYEMGLTTVLMDHPSQPDELPPHVHARFDRAADFLNHIADEVEAAESKFESQNSHEHK